MSRLLLGFAGALGALAVGLGAFGAHGLEGWIGASEHAARQLAWWDTAVSYHLPHAVLIALVSVLTERRPSRPLIAAGVALAAGVLAFSGTLYSMSLGGPRWLGAITPLGGLSLMVGWLCLGVAALRRSPSEPVDASSSGEG